MQFMNENVYEYVCHFTGDFSPQSVRTIITIYKIANADREYFCQLKKLTFTETGLFCKWGGTCKYLLTNVFEFYAKVH